LEFGIIKYTWRPGLHQVIISQKVKFVPVFYIEEDEFFRYELAVNHEIMKKLAPSKIKKSFYF